MMINLDDIKERASKFTGYHSAEQNIAAVVSARDVPALVAEVERLAEAVDDLRSDVARLTRERDEWEANEQVQAREVDRLKAVIAGLMRDHPVVGRSFRVDL